MWPDLGSRRNSQRENAVSIRCLLTKSDRVAFHRYSSNWPGTELRQSHTVLSSAAFRRLIWLRWCRWWSRRSRRCRCGLGGGCSSVVGRWIRRRCCRRCRRWGFRSLVVAELQIDGLNLEGHLVCCCQKRFEGRVHDEDLVGPRIEAQEAGQRHGRLLFEILHVELWSLGNHGLHPEGRVFVVLDEGVTDHRLVERLQVLHPLLQLLQVKAEVLLSAFEFLRA